jgi:anti-anti-sigma factor
VSEETPLEALKRATSRLKHFSVDVPTGAADRGLLVSLAGYLDGDAANTVMEALTSLVLGWDGAPQITIELSRLEYISSLGIGMLTTLAVNAHRRSFTMKLQDPQKSVLHVLELLGIPQYIPVTHRETGEP